MPFKEAITSLPWPLCGHPTSDQSDHMPIACDSPVPCHASTRSSMSSSPCLSQRIQSGDECGPHQHPLWLGVNNTMRWSLFWIVGWRLEGYSSWSIGRLWVWGELLGEWTQCEYTMTDFTVLLQSSRCTSSHSCDSLQQHELPSWSPHPRCGREDGLQVVCNIDHCIKWFWVSMKQRIKGNKYLIRKCM